MQAQILPRHRIYNYLRYNRIRATNNNLPTAPKKENIP